MDTTTNRGVRLLGLGTALIAVFIVGRVYLNQTVLEPAPVVDTTPQPAQEPISTTETPVTTPTPTPITPKPTNTPTPTTPKPITSTPTPIAPTPQPVDVPKKTTYKNGTYTSTGNYNSPGGGETITVTVTIVDDVIVSSSVVGHAENPTSKQYQGMFIGGYQQFVMGKSLDLVNLGAVSGSSLTPRGWNDAVLKIQTQARA